MELIVFKVIVLVFAAVVHEVSHGYVADWLGDPTARLAGRLTFNPLRHLDPFGSVILPFLMSLLPGGVIFGWAKPVPYNPYNLKHPARDGALIAAAGPLSNFLLAVVFGTIIRISSGGGVFLDLIAVIVLINIVLGVFNLVPIPPLDGSKVLFAFLPASAHRTFLAVERYGIYILLFFIFFGIEAIQPLILWIFRALTGVTI